MRTIFTIKKELEMQVAQLTGDLEAAVKLADEAQSRIKVLEAENTELKAKATGVPQAEFEALKAEKENLLGQLTKISDEIEELKTKNADVETAASYKALEILSAAGTPQVPIAPTDNPAVMVSENILGIGSRYKVYDMNQKKQ